MEILLLIYYNVTLYHLCVRACMQTHVQAFAPIMSGQVHMCGKHSTYMDAIILMQGLIQEVHGVASHPPYPSIYAHHVICLLNSNLNMVKKLHTMKHSRGKAFMITIKA